MAGRLKQAEFLAETLAHRVTQVLAERDRLRGELARESSGRLSREKAYVAVYRQGAASREYSDAEGYKLRRMLSVR